MLFDQSILPNSKEKSLITGCPPKNVIREKRSQMVKTTNSRSKICQLRAE